MDENLTPAADMSVVDAPTIENVTVDAPVIENKIQDFTPGSPAQPEPAEAVYSAPTEPAAATSENLYFDNRQSVSESSSGGFDAQNEYTIQQHDFTPQGNIGIENVYAGQNYPSAGGYGGQNYGGNSSYMNSGMGGYAAGYDYGYNRGEYSSTDYIPDGMYTNDPFSSFYYEEEEERRPEKNGAAVAAMILGIVSLATFYTCTGWIPGIIAISLGAVGLRKQVNHGKAVAGFIMGILGTLIGGFMVLYYIINII